MTDAAIDALKALIRDAPDFPKPGIVFKDITPLLADRGHSRHARPLRGPLHGGASTR